MRYTACQSTFLTAKWESFSSKVFQSASKLRSGSLRDCARAAAQVISARHTRAIRGFEQRITPLPGDTLYHRRFASSCSPGIRCDTVRAAVAGCTLVRGKGLSHLPRVQPPAGPVVRGRSANAALVEQGREQMLAFIPIEYVVEIEESTVTGD